jgi:hypothetical protein
VASNEVRFFAWRVSSEPGTRKVSPHSHYRAWRPSAERIFPRDFALAWAKQALAAAVRANRPVVHDAALSAYHATIKAMADKTGGIIARLWRCSAASCRCCRRTRGSRGSRRERHLIRLNRNLAASSEARLEYARRSRLQADQPRESCYRKEIHLTHQPLSVHIFRMASTSPWEEGCPMFPGHFVYPILSRILGVVLVVAGTLKAAELVRPNADQAHPWMTAIAVGIEFALGVWLLLGLHSHWARLVTLICFMLFWNVALWGVVNTQQSCGCLGPRISVRPWIAVAFDTFAIGALLFWSPTGSTSEGGQFSRRHGLILGATLGAAAIVLINAYWDRPHVESKASLDPAPDPSGIDAIGLAAVIEGLERNRAALGTVTFQTEETSTEHPVAAMTKYMGGTEEAKKAYLRRGDRTGRYRCDLAYRDQEIRVSRRCLQSPNSDAAGKHDMLLVGSKGRRVYYVRGLEQAFLTTMKSTADEDDGRTVDVRCAGFRPPIQSIADWLRQQEVLAAGMVKTTDGRLVFKVKAIEKRRNRRSPDIVTATFEPEFNYLPSRVVYWFYPTGGVFIVTDIRYSRVAKGRGWFPETIRTRSFIRDTNEDPDAVSGQNITNEITISNLNVDPQLPDEVFDPVLPSRTKLLGDLAATARLGDQPERASEFIRSEPRKLTRDPDESVRSRAGWFWPIALVVNTVALSLGVAFRKRFAFCRPDSTWRTSP